MPIVHFSRWYQIFFRYSLLHLPKRISKVVFLKEHVFFRIHTRPFFKVFIFFLQELWMPGTFASFISFVASQIWSRPRKYSTASEPAKSSSFSCIKSSTQNFDRFIFINEHEAIGDTVRVSVTVFLEDEWGSWKPFLFGVVQCPWVRMNSSWCLELMCFSANKKLCSCNVFNHALYTRLSLFWTHL